MVERIRGARRVTRRQFLGIVAGAGLATALRPGVALARPADAAPRFQFSQKRTWIELYGSLGETLTAFDRVYGRGIAGGTPTEAQALRALAAQGFNRVHLLASRRTNNVRYVDEVLRQARGAGLRVNAWFFPFDGVDFKPLINVHPEWEFRTREGSRKRVSLEVDTDFDASLFGPYEHRLCPYHPETRRLALDYYAGYLRRHAPDGFHLDWELQPCYNAYCRAAFRRETGLDPAAIKPFHPDLLAWRVRQNTAFLREAARLVRQLRPRIELSLAVPFPDESGFSVYDTSVDYREAGRLVDVIEPLVYLDEREDVERIRKAIEATKRLVPERVVVSPAIILRGRNKGDIKSADRVAEEVRAVADAAPQGISLWEARYGYAASLRSVVAQIPNRSRVRT